MADPEIRFVPPKADIKPLPSVSGDHSVVKELIDTIGQNFGEMARAQRETAEYMGEDLSKHNDRVESINKSLESAADEIARLDAELKRYQASAVAKHEDPEYDLQDLRNTEEFASAMEIYMRLGPGNLTDEQRITLAKGNAYHKVLELTRAAEKAKVGWDPVNAVSAGGLSTTFGPGAGVWARPEYDREITRVIVEHSPIRQFARVTNIGGPEFVGSFRTSNRDTIEQTGEYGTSAGPTQQTQMDRYEERRIKPYIFWAKPGLTTEMIEDSLIDIEGEVLADVALDFAVDEATNFTTGAGGNTIEGYASDTSVGGITSETSGTITQKDLLDLALSLRPPYRTGPKVAFAFSTTAFRLAILHEDGLGRRLWEPSHQDKGMPSLYQGWPYFEATELAAVAAASKSVFFANWPQFYRIVDRRGTNVIRDDITTDGLVILKHSRRYGGRTWKTEAGKVLTTKS